MHKRWGEVFLWASLTALGARKIFDALNGAESIDWTIFRSSARLVAQGTSPYGILYAGCEWLYSPAAALFYWPFAQLPYAPGLAILTGVMVAAFTFGTIWLLRAHPLNSTRQQIFCAWTACEMMGTLGKYKIELLFMGVIFFALANLLQSGRRVLSFGLLTLIAVFKIQAFATIGLLGVGWWAVGGGLSPLIVSGAVCVLIVALTFVFLPLHFGAALWTGWLPATSQFAAREFWQYGHIYSFVRHVTGWAASLGQVAAIEVVAAIAMAIYIATTARRERNHYNMVARSFALGGFFSVVLSPLAQNGAFILICPLLWDFIRKGSASPERPTYRVVLVISFFLISLVYSDVGKLLALRAFANDVDIKPFGACILLLGYLWIDYRAIRVRPKLS